MLLPHGLWDNGSPREGVVALSKNAREVSMSNIFVGNLTFRTTEADICALFELYGEV